MNPVPVLASFVRYRVNPSFVPYHSLRSGTGHEPLICKREWFMVEVGGFEPPSSNLNLEDATCLSYLLISPFASPMSGICKRPAFYDFAPHPKSESSGTILHTGATSSLPGNQPEGLSQLRD